MLDSGSELFLNNEYVEALCSEESITEVIPYLLSLLPLTEIPTTATSTKMVERLRRDSDSTHDFFTKYCVTGPTKWVTKRDLYDAYTQFCIDSGREAHKKHSFNRHMILQGYRESRHPKTREACWRGVGLKKGR